MFGFTSKLFSGHKKPARTMNYKPQFDALEKRELMSATALMSVVSTSEVAGTISGLVAGNAGDVVTGNTGGAVAGNVGGAAAGNTGGVEGGNNGTKVDVDPTTPLGLAFINSLADPRVRAVAMQNYQLEGQITRSGMLDIFEKSTFGWTDLTTSAKASLIQLIDNGYKVEMPGYVRELSKSVMAAQPVGSVNPVQTLKKAVDNFYLGLERPQYVGGYIPVNGKQLWIGTPKATDVQQTTFWQSNWFLTSLQEVVSQDANDIKNMFIVNGDDTYTVRFFHQVDGRSVYVTVDKYLPGISDAIGGGNEKTLVMWPSLIMKAYIQASAAGFLPSVVWAPGAAPPLGVNVNSYAAVGLLNGAGGNAKGNPEWVFKAITGLTTSTQSIPSNVYAVGDAWAEGHYVVLHTRPVATKAVAGVAARDGASPLLYQTTDEYWERSGVPPLEARWYALVNVVFTSEGRTLFTVTWNGSTLYEVDSSYLRQNFDRWAHTSGAIRPAPSHNAAFGNPQTQAVEDYLAAHPDSTVFVDDSQQLPRLRRDHGFHFQGSYYQNHSGQQEKWFVDRLGQWHSILPSGEVRGPGGVVVAQLDQATYADPTRLFQADVKITDESLAQLSDLRRQHGFQASGGFYENASGRHEKWLKDRSGTWHFITPDGTLRRWAVSMDASPVVATLDPLVFDDPARLLNASVNLRLGTEAQLSALRHMYGLVMPASFSENWGGMHEKWFKDRTGAWFFMTPDGNLRKWSVSMTASPVVAGIDPLVYDDMKLLFQAPVALDVSAREQATRFQAMFGFKSAGSYFVNHSGLGEKWLQDRTGKWFVILASGELHQWSSTGLSVKTLVVKLDVLVYDDPMLMIGL